MKIYQVEFEIIEIEKERFGKRTILDGLNFNDG